MAFSLKKMNLRIDPEADAATRLDSPSKAKSSPHIHGPVKKQSMANLRKAFNAYDEEHAGTMLAASVGVALWSCGIAVPAGEETQSILSGLVPDYEPEGKLTFDQFLQVARDFEQRGYGAASPRANDTWQSPEPSPRSPGKAQAGRRKSLSRRAVMSSNWEVGADDEGLAATIRQLDEQRRACEQEGDYQEAGRIAKRLQDLKIGEESKRMAAMEDRQAQELRDAEGAYQAEVEETNGLWDTKMAEFQSSVVEQVARLKEQHVDATRLLRANFETRKPTRAQPSVKLLDQRKIQHTLGKQGKYDEADQVKKVADKLERSELQVAESAWLSELALKEQTLASHQQVELDALMQRATRGRDELRKARSMDLERREQRFNNVRMELEAVHKMEALKFEGNLEKKIIAGKRDEKAVASSSVLNKARRASVSAARSRSASRTSKVSYSAF